MAFVVSLVTDATGNITVLDAGPSTIALWVLKAGTSVQVTTLRLLPSTYDCQTGFIRFQTSGGGSLLIEYAATGITDWTRNPNQFVEKALRTAFNIEPLPILPGQYG